jgi:hypothetical protein
VCVNQEILTFTGLLNRQATTYEAMAALGNSTSAVVAARAKKAVACLLWMNGQPPPNWNRWSCGPAGTGMRLGRAERKNG